MTTEHLGILSICKRNSSSVSLMKACMRMSGLRHFWAFTKNSCQKQRFCARKQSQILVWMHSKHMLKRARGNLCPCISPAYKDAGQAQYEGSPGCFSSGRIDVSMPPGEGQLGVAGVYSFHRLARLHHLSCGDIGVRSPSQKDTATQRKRLGPFW